MTKSELQEILAAHALWLSGKTGGKRADLRGADLQEAYLRGADLQEAYLQEAYLRGADLQGASLRGADLQGASLRGADLQGASLRGAYLQEAYLQEAYLRGADLQGADLQEANLWGANLWGANLQGASLRGADLQDAKLPDFDILPKIETFQAFKKVRGNIILGLLVKRANAVCSLIGRKCRASEVLVVSASSPGPYISIHDNTFTYQVGEVVRATLDADIRVECTPGVHFFLTREEAEEYLR